jgi:hypothetical protein
MKVLTLILVAAFMVGSVQSAYALPNKMAEHNPQVVAYYPGPDDIHGIVGEDEKHTGWDLVKKNGNSGSFQQWFYGESETEGLHGEHSLWKVSKDGTCPDNFHLVYNDYENSNSFWGKHLEDDTYYCVMTHDFKPSK